MRFEMEFWKEIRQQVLTKELRQVIFPGRMKRLERFWTVTASRQ